MTSAPFDTALPLYKPVDTDLLRMTAEGRIINMIIDRAARKLSLTVCFEGLKAPSELSRMGEGIRAAYGLEGVAVTPRYDRRLFCDGFADCFMEYLRESYPTLSGFFSRSECAVEENLLSVALPAGGAAFAERLGVAREAQRYLCEVFGCDGIRVELSEGETGSAEEELDDVIRRTVPVSEPQSAPAAPKPAPKPAEKPKNSFRTPRAPRPTNVSDDDVLLGKPFGEENTPMSGLSLESGRAAVCGEVFFTEFKSISNGARTVATFDMTDKTGSVRVRKLMTAEEGAVWEQKIKAGTYLRVRGDMEYDRFISDCVMKPLDIYFAKKPAGRADTAEKKRVELHMHTNLSAYDGVSATADLVKRAESWGMPAIAVTDHGVTQAYPDALHAAKKIKILYGCEGYFVSTESDADAVRGGADEPLDGEFVCFDLETTGTNPAEDGITEISAVIVRAGEPAEVFHTYVNPGKLIPPFITELTGITDDMVRSAPPPEECVRALREFCGERILVAHNARFDVSFVNAVCARIGERWDITSIDTLEMSRILLPNAKKHKLNFVAEELGLPEFRHHSAEADAQILALIFIEFLKRLRGECGVQTVAGINPGLGDLRRGNFLGGKKDSYPVRHIIILVKNLVGLKNLYKLVSYGHLKYMNGRKQPIIPKHELTRLREGLIIGSACEAGELYRALLEKKDPKEIRRIAKYYDFLEIQPLGNNEFMLRNGIVRSEEDLRELNRQILALGDELGIPVAATGDVHFLDPEDEVYRRIIMAGKGFDDADKQPPLYLRTTEEMLREFEYLGSRAYEVVVENTNRIADMCEKISPVPDGMFPPELPGSAEELTYLTYKKARELYGDPLPETVQKRVDRELKPITGHGFDVMYMIAQKLIARSNENGYLVGSRGSVGSSVVAYFSGITEINALPPHYRCPECRYSEFHPEADCGLDMEPKDCPKCGAHMIKDGFNIPFETFLGFDGDKAPDIDLNFSGDYQAKAHRHTVELFGEDKVFRAGTLSTVADKTAFGYVRKYLDERGMKVSKAEENRLTIGCTGIKATTGQHPGGLIVVPKNKEIYDFCPVQHPPTDDTTITTHIDYHSIDTNLLKLDLLGKDDPTVLRYLEDNTGIRVDDVPIDDPDTLEIFLSNRTLGIEDDDITGPNGALGIPEYGTGFVRGMLVDTEPRTISDLVRISGLSHGTDVWLGNAQSIIADLGMKLSDCICCRDDIMNYLIGKGVDPKLSFTIMEGVRKPKRQPDGRKLKQDWEDEMRAHDVPDWYIDCCNKIGYLFPKAHAAAYVVMALRIAWFKVHRPLAYYGSWFTIKAKENSFDVEAMLSGDEAVVRSLAAAEEKAHETKATATDKELVRTLEIAHEFIKRGFKFLPVDLYSSDADRFLLVPEENALRLPFRAVTGLGNAAAEILAAERKKGSFASMDQITARCSGVSETVVKELKRIGALGDMPESSQSSLF